MLFRIACFISEIIAPEIIGSAVVGGAGWFAHYLFANNKKAFIVSCCVIAGVFALVLVWYFCAEPTDGAQTAPVHQTIHYSYGRYEGEAVNGKPNGQGVMYYANGGRYEGAFANGHPNGQGVRYWTDGTHYVGKWKNGRMNDEQGVYYHPNGDRYEGVYKNGVPNGKGVYYWSNGNRYEGEWKNGKRNGQGVLYYADGRSEKQEYKNGVKIG